MCARFQAAPKELHHLAVKRILRYLAYTPTLGLWYPKGLEFDLFGFSDADYAGDKVDRKSTSGTCHFLERSLVCWSSKKQNCVSLSTAESEYIAAGSCCAQLLWMKQHSKTMAFIWSKYHSAATMKAPSRLPTTQFSTRRQSTLKFVITFSEIMLWRKTLISYTLTLKSNWQISSPSPWMRRGFASCGVS